MKLFSISLLAITLQVSAAAYSQRVTYAATSVNLKQVFREFKKQTGYFFFYDNREIANSVPVTVDVKHLPLEQALEQVLSGQPFDFQVQGTTISITQKAVQRTPISSEGASYLRLAVIKGIVKDSSGIPLPGASVAIKNSDGTLRKGVVTNATGAFTINAAIGDVLVISFVGYIRKEVTITSEAPLDIMLSAASNVMEQVVVTALGIRKTTKALTYHVQEVKGEEISRVPDASFVNALAGKVAGITINSSASGIGGSTRVVMRGDKSLSATGNNNALYVLDGIPLPNLFSSSSVTTNGVYGGKDGGEGISDFNAEDIASMSVLTGAASAALYGGMAANGALLINTKKGSSTGTRISFSNATNFYKPFVLPAFQNTYGTSAPGSFDSWGQKLAIPSSYDPADFFETGMNVSNSISLATGNAKNQTYLSAATSNAKGIIPNNTFDRYNLTLRNTTYYLDNKLTLDITAMYVRSKNQNMRSQGQYLNPLVPIYLFPRGDDIEKYKVFERYNPDRNFKTQFWPASYGTQNMAMQNPYWTINRDFSTIDKERYILGANLTYRALSWLTLMARVRADHSANRNEVKNYASTLPLLTANSLNGSYLDLTATTRNTYADMLVSIEKSFGNVGLTANAGASLLDNRFRLSGNALGGDGAPLSKVPNLFSSTNIIPQPQPGSQPDITQTQSVYATAQTDYKQLVYLNLSARNEWPSQLANNSGNKRSLFYPSAGLSVIASDLLQLPKNIFSFLKIRGSYSEVGNPPLLFMANPPYEVSVSGPSLNRDLPFNLLPERTKSYEAGITANFLANKLSLDVTVYKANTFNQIFTFTAPGGSGFANYFINAGNVQNKGIEASLSYNGAVGVVRFNSGVTFTMNRNRILELAGNAVNPFTGRLLETSDTMYMAGIGSASSAAVLGSAIGDIYVNSLMTDPHGYILINNTTGGMVQVNNKQLIYAGNPNPLYKVSFRNGISYGNFQFNFLIDWRIGGRVVSSTQAIMDGYGVSKASADARDNQSVLINGYSVDAKRYYQTVGLGTGVLSQYVYSATNARLREASLSYSLPTVIFKHKLRELTLSLIGRNLFMFYNKAPFDPENTASTGTYFQGIDYFMAPSLRSFGFSVKASL
ncbi:SusC/RagA family TonB-linked outer membrane protein [Chitinophaga pendula]|uniref:SusC/RagA family TonB-linked outer membrane protein n=1 Tax=Chitinophaga TaxID=79328 RepID=UPI0018E01441|nr:MULTISPECIES: SusC/RagA family TonB-linked outer membrane protein [Chitinophaga]UCJ10167.1 SusC/RagA family TonB-linked outer membrane protein [Chitinophaga pendula]